MILRLLVLLTVVFVGLTAFSQTRYEEVQMTKKEFIISNHLEDIEDLIHKFARSRNFIEFLLEEGHQIDHSKVESISRRDISIGEDVDIYVKHFTPHQNYTMIMVPVNIYSMAIYDTLLFSVLEVSDEWIKEKFWERNVTNDSVKAHLLSIENHRILSEHMVHLALGRTGDDITEMEVKLHEGYISTASISYHINNLTNSEKRDFRKSWGLIKKALTHNVDLNVEMNIYIFGYDDMEVNYYSDGDIRTHRITPQNIFKRHHFIEE